MWRPAIVQNCKLYEYPLDPIPSKRHRSSSTLQDWTNLTLRLIWTKSSVGEETLFILWRTGGKPSTWFTPGGLVELSNNLSSAVRRLREWSGFNYKHWYSFLRKISENMKKSRKNHHLLRKKGFLEIDILKFIWPDTHRISNFNVEDQGLAQ